MEFINIMIYRDYYFECNGGSLSQNQNEYFIDLLEKYKPKNICELGCGQSTLIFKKYCEINGGKLLSIEHDINYVMHDNTKLLDYTIGDFMGYSNCNYYIGLEKIIKESNKLFDFILVDGPIGVNGCLVYSRIQAIDFVLYNKISNNCVMLIHDTERVGEKNTIIELEKLLIDKKYTFEKNTVIDEIGRELTCYIIKKVRLSN